MLADPQSVTINGSAVSVAKTSMGPTSNTFTSADGVTTLTTKQNTTAARFRREVRVSQHKVVADPVSGVNKDLGLSVYLVIDEPRYGFSDTEISYLIEGLKSWLSAGNYNKILAGEY
jgi:hypothetical protein